MLSVESELDSLIQSSSSQQQVASFWPPAFFVKRNSFCHQRTQAKFISPSKNASKIHFAIKERKRNSFRRQATQAKCILS